jgi:signal transduction histidine kinase/CheY-like chemotaxis protein
MLRVFLSILVCLVSSTLLASNKISEDQNLVFRSLGLHVQYIVEDKPSVNLDNILNNPLQFKWKKSLNDTPNFGFNVAPHWFAVDIINASTEKESWLLQIPYSHLDYIDVYLTRANGSIEQWHTGDRNSFDSRPIDHRSFLFPLELKSQEHTHLLFRVQSSGSMQVPMQLWNEREFYKTVQKRSIPNGIFIGLFLILIIYNLFLYISTRDSSYVYYVLFASGFMSFFISISGYGFQYIWSTLPEFQQLSVFIFTCLSNIGMAEFTIKFLRIPKVGNLTYKMLRFVTLVTSFCFILMLILPYKFMIQVLMFVCLYTSAISTYVGYKKISEMGIVASFYACGWFIMAAGVAILVLNKFAILDANLFTDYAAPVSVAIFSLLLSFALGIRIQQERKYLLTAENKVLTSQQEVLQSRLKANQLEFKSHEIKVKAEVESQSKNAFLAMMSHEIRTPLNGIMGLSDLLRSSKLDDQQKQYAETIYSSGESLLTIINDILDFSKILAGKLDIESIPVNAFDLINNCTGIFSNELKEKNINLFINIYPAIPFSFKSDPVRLRQVIINYLSNAIKFTDNGDINLNMSLNLETERLRIEVKDQGIGIPPDKQSNLFNAFTQADTTTTRKYGGTGLGLAICKQLSQLMEGSIGVDSMYGEGSTFWFDCKVEIIDRDSISTPISLHKNYLSALNNNAEHTHINTQLKQWGCQLTPISSEKKGTAYDGLFIDIDSLTHAAEAQIYANHKIPMRSLYSLGNIQDNASISRPITTPSLFNIVDSDHKNKIEPKKIQPNDGIAPRPLNGLNILVAEDNPVNQVVIQAVLKKLGAEFTLVENGELALQEMKTRPGNYDIVLMDCEMPVMDGFTASKHIRALPSDQTILTPIIALTAHAMTAHKDKAKESGMNGFVTKPLERDDLVNTIKAVLSGTPNI